MLRLSSALGIALALCASAQDFRATISGRVTDSSGAAIPNAKVRAIQQSTNDTVPTVTDQDGFYTLPYLQPSTYAVEAEADGFSLRRIEKITLMVAQKYDLPIQMEVGKVTEKVTVMADAADLQTADASGGMNFDSLITSEYPLNGRQVYMLMDLTPGVLFTQEEFGSSGYSGTRGWDVSSSYVMNGGVQGTNSFSLNGAPVSLTGTWQLAPNMDAIQEFKVMTNTYDAAIGRTGGGSVNTTLKSGSNAWHGTMFDFIRNSVLDANYTQNNQVGAPRGKHITNQFGGTIGGPVRRDKDFIFASFEGFRERVPFPVVADVPPMDLRDGQHFSEYKITVYDPLTGHDCVDHVSVSGTCSSPYIRNPFPGDVLPPSRISPIGQKILSFYPAPNAPGFTQNYVFSNSTGQYRYDQPMFRWDRVIDPENRLYTLFTFQHGHEYRNQTGIPGPAAGGNIWTQRTDLNLIADWTRILSPTAIFDLRASFGRFTSYFPDADTSTGVTAADVGMSLPHAPTSTSAFPPRFMIDQFSNLFGGTASATSSNLYTWGTDNQYNIVPTLTVTRGNKTIKFGADLVYAMRGSGSIGRANGQFSFTRYATQQYPLYTGSSTNGSGVGDALLGIPGSGLVDWNDTFYRTWPYFGFFVQNDWKIAPRLTLNLGLRYDVQVPWVERWNRTDTGFDFNAVNPLSATLLPIWQTDQAAYDATNPRFSYPTAPPALLGGKTFLVPGGTRRAYLTDWQNIQPRIGVAWLFAKETVLRAGFGIFHRTATQTNYADGFSQQTPYIRSLNGDINPDASLTGPYSLADPFPNGLITPSGSSLGLLTNVGSGVSFDGQQRLIPRTFQYSFGLERRLFAKVLMDASYVGSITDHDTMSLNMDYIPMADYLQGQAVNTFLDRTVPNPFFGILPSNTTLGASANIAAKYLYYPYPLFNSVTMSTNPWARYRYDSLQLRAEKRFLGNRNAGGALTAIFTYTFSKNLQTANRLNNWDYSETPVHELVSYDKPQNLSFSSVWDLPFGKGRHFFTATNRWLDGAIGGWTMNLIYRYNSGFPVAGINALSLCPELLIPNQTHYEWFNNTKGCYKALPEYTLRTAPDHYPWLRQMDNITVNLSGAKTFRVTERWRFDLRGEAFNLFNHPLYGPPDTTYTDTRFGMLPVGQQNFPRLIQVSGKVMF